MKLEDIKTVISLKNELEQIDKALVDAPIASALHRNTCLSKISFDEPNINWVVPNSCISIDDIIKGLETRREEILRKIEEV